MKRLLLGRIEVAKKHPLTISRGTSSGSTNVFAGVEFEGVVGIGEASPGGKWDNSMADEAESQLREFCAANPWQNWCTAETYDKARQWGMMGPAQAALDCALWDMEAKRAGIPLFRMLGLSDHAVPTDVTVGLNPPEVTRERTREWLEDGYRALKIKLGSPHGIEFDKDHFEAARETAEPYGVTLRVDANGGWSLEDALSMIRWLAERGVEYVEQPLHATRDEDLPALFKASPLPLFADESCQYAEDVIRLKDCVHGVNLKLMKCGGITGALRIVHTARACGLRVMAGCMGESSIAIGAAAAIGSLFDYLDLDSHHNLAPDPAEGLRYEEGAVRPSAMPGHGVRFKAEFGDTLKPC